MNFFESELRKLFASGTPVIDPRFTGRICVGRLGGTTSVKLEFEIKDTMNHYEAIRATVFNRNEGKIDSAVFRFGDLLGRKTLASARHISFDPYIWANDDNVRWYGYQPTRDDYAAIAGAVGRYLEVFLEPERERQHEKPSVLAQIRTDKQKPRQPKTVVGPNQKRGGPEM